MDYSSDNIFSKKNIIAYLLLAIIILAIPVGVRLAQTQTQIQSRAQAGGELKFPKTRTQQCDQSGENCTTTSRTIDVEIRSPFTQ